MQLHSLGQNQSSTEQMSLIRQDLPFAFDDVTRTIEYKQIYMASSVCMLHKLLKRIEQISTNIQNEVHMQVYLAVSSSFQTIQENKNMIGQMINKNSNNLSVDQKNTLYQLYNKVELLGQCYENLMKIMKIMNTSKAIDVEIVKPQLEQLLSTAKNIPDNTILEQYSCAQLAWSIICHQEVTFQASLISLPESQMHNENELEYFEEESVIKSDVDLLSAQCHQEVTLQASSQDFNNSSPLPQIGGYVANFCLLKQQLIDNITKSDDPLNDMIYPSTILPEDVHNDCDHINPSSFPLPELQMYNELEYFTEVTEECVAKSDVDISSTRCSKGIFDVFDQDVNNVLMQDQDIDSYCFHADVDDISSVSNDGLNLVDDVSNSIGVVNSSKECQLENQLHVNNVEPGHIRQLMKNMKDEIDEINDAQLLKWYNKNRAVVRYEFCAFLNVIRDRDIKWRNTINNIESFCQQMIDMIHYGYKEIYIERHHDTIQINKLYNACKTILNHYKFLRTQTSKIPKRGKIESKQVSFLHVDVEEYYKATHKEFFSFSDFSLDQLFNYHAQQQSSQSMQATQLQCDAAQKLLENMHDNLLQQIEHYLYIAQNLFKKISRLCKQSLRKKKMFVSDWNRWSKEMCNILERYEQFQSGIKNLEEVINDTQNNYGFCVKKPLDLIKFSKNYYSIVITTIKTNRKCRITRVMRNFYNKMKQYYDDFFFKQDINLRYQQTIFKQDLNLRYQQTKRQIEIENNDRSSTMFECGDHLFSENYLPLENDVACTTIMEQQEHDLVKIQQEDTTSISIGQGNDKLCTELIDNLFNYCCNNM